MAGTKRTARRATRKGAAAATKSTTSGGTAKCGWCLDGLHDKHHPGTDTWTCNCKTCEKETA